MTRRHYSSAASETALTNSISNSVTAILLDAVTGFPGSFPYELIIDPGTASEECVLVTGGTGTSLTVTRGFDGTTGLSHAAGAKVVHGVSAIDFDEANAHVNASTGAHGAAGAVVGTTDAQALTNKDLTSATNTFPAAWPRGVLGYAQVTTAQAGIPDTPVTDLTNLTTTVTVAAGRRIRVTAKTAWGSAAGFDTSVFTYIVQDGLSVVSGKQFINKVATGSPFLSSGVISVVLTPSAGSHTYKLQGQTGTGGSTASMSASSGDPAWILVEDIGV